MPGAVFLQLEGRAPPNPSKTAEAARGAHTCAYLRIPAHTAEGPGCRARGTDFTHLHSQRGRLSQVTETLMVRAVVSLDHRKGAA